MASENTTVEKAKTAKERRSWSVAFTGGKDETFTLVVERRKNGWRTCAWRTTGTGKTKTRERGMTTPHPDERTARAAHEAAVAQAAKAGWTRKESRGGFSGKPDAFTALPKPTLKK